MASLPSKQSYDDLNGEEALELLHTRFYDWVHTIPEFQRRFALTRCILRLEIAVDIWGASPPQKTFHHKYELEATGPLPPVYQESAEAQYEKAIIIDSRANPPDLIREEHGLALPEAEKQSYGFHETVMRMSDETPRYPRPPIPRPASELPANQPNPNMKQIGRRRYAAFVEQDYGALTTGERTGAEGPVVGAQKISESGWGGGGDHAPVQPDFVVGNLETSGRLTEDRGREIVSRAIEKGLQVDQTLADNDRIAGREEEIAPPPDKPPETPEPKAPPPVLRAKPPLPLPLPRPLKPPVPKGK